MGSDRRTKKKSSSRQRSRSRDSGEREAGGRARLRRRRSRGRSGSGSSSSRSRSRTSSSTGNEASKDRRQTGRRRQRALSPLSLRLKAIEYVTHGKHRKLRLLLRRQGRGPDILAALESGGRRTLLHEACACGHARVARVLLLHGAPAGLADATGDTPAHLAARAGHLQALAEVMQAVDAPPLELAGAGGTTLRELMAQALGNGIGGGGGADRAGATNGRHGANVHPPDELEDDEAAWRRRLREECSDGEGGGGGDDDWGGGDPFGGPQVEDDDAWANRLWKEMQQRRRAAAAASAASFTANLREEAQRKAEAAAERSRHILQEEQAKDAEWRRRTVLAIEAGPTEPPLDLVAARAAYDMRWEQLDAASVSSSSSAPRAPLRYWDIPWPLENPHNSTGAGGDGGSSKRPPPAHTPPPPRVDALRDFFLVGAAGPADIKKRLRAELLRWHPDKFGARFGARLEAAGHAHRTCALTRVTELAKVLTQVLSAG
ncbi:hypothetical protein HYH02_000899 [Chlamydomonas schloesseri]|uniref:NF-kappa-B inhibitor-like protein 1 n=1 Tax=Chlamydomonas schloesseri TaxID=2026947 RepID=A0A836BD39_9CHLO|nr:hypothetical protein HYH02_000899 [Chlamydomonas schloesseri]|eukprot:KAG2455077.1 hypothetical protein HYH02_000899 [Chlamydomonas schloesseri]